MSERRRFKRLPTSLIARIQPRRATQAETLQMQVRNVSTGGLFIDTLYPFPVGSLVEIDFNLPGDKGQVHAKCVVRWTQSEGDVRGMGVEFMEVSTASRSVIQGYIQELVLGQRPASPPEPSGEPPRPAPPQP